MAQKNTKSEEKSMTKSTLSRGPQEITENYIIIWLDPNLDFSNEDNQAFISQLQSIVKTIKTFSDYDQCINFLQQIKNEKVFLIIAGCFLKQIASIEERFTQLNSIYVFCDQKSNYNQTIKTYKKGKGVFTQMKPLCNELKKEIRQLNNDLVSISIVSASSTTNLNELDPSFMYFQLLKENILTIKYNHDMEIQQLVDYCRPHFEKDEDEIRRIIDLEQNYGEHTPIWWYTLESFLYGMLNHALRTFDIDILVKMGFFIQDLHEQIKQRHSNFRIVKNPLTVYRGQGMFNNEFEKLQKNANGGFLSFNSFLSTSIEKSVAKHFACYNLNDEDRKAILFEIELDTSISSVPFTSVKDLSAVPGEEEILFSMSTVFRIGEIKEIEKGLWKVNLSLTSDRDPLLKRLTDHMRISLGSGNGWRRLGQLMIKLGQFDKAMEIYKILLKTVDLDDKTETAFLHNQLGYVFKQKDKLEEAFSHYQQALKINRTYMSDTDARLSSIYSNMGGIMKKLGDANEALKYYELVLKIDLAASKPNPLEIAIDHNNIGSVLDDQGKYPNALKSYEEALNIKLTHLPPHHPSLASTYSNIGLIHRKMGDCSTALSFYEKTLQIQQKSLPSNHPSFVVTYGKLATVLEELRRYQEAIEYAQQAVKIANQVFGSSDPETEKRQKYLKELQQKI
jgi:tetratricopeptide (TPR) repeat protein